MIQESDVHPPDPPVTVTVAIPTRGRPDGLGAVVRDVCAGERRPDEILVVCQGEDAMAVGRELRDTAPEAMPLLHFYVSDRTGASASRNDAIRLAEGEFIAFSDDDMRLPPTWLRTMIEIWERDWNRGSVLITGPIDAPEDASDLRVAPGRRAGDTRRVWESAPSSGDVLYGGHFGAPRAAFAVLGERPFDERFGPGAPFPGAGDEEFALRMLDAGVPIVFDPALRATHLAGADTWVASLFVHSQGAGAMFVSRLQERRPKALGAALRTAAGLVSRGLRSSLRLRLRESAGWFASLAGMSLGATRWLFGGGGPKAVRTGERESSRPRLADLG